MTDAKLKELKGLAEKATDGEWWYCGHNRGGCICGAIYSKKYDFVIATAMVGESEGWVQTVKEECGKANQAYIAAANPQTVLELIAEIESHKKLMSDMLKYLDDNLCGGQTPTIVRNTIEQHLRMLEAHK